jgi:hypothetical protein
MKKLSSDEKTILDTFNFALFITLFQLVNIFWRLIYKAAPITPVNYDGFVILAICTFISIYLFRNFPFVRPSFKNVPPLIIFFRLSDYLAALIALNFAASLIMHGLFIEGPAKMIGQEFIWLGVFSLYVILTEFIFIPTAERHHKIMQANKRSTAPNFLNKEGVMSKKEIAGIVILSIVALFGLLYLLGMFGGCNFIQQVQNEFFHFMNIFFGNLK